MLRKTDIRTNVQRRKEKNRVLYKKEGELTTMRCTEFAELDTKVQGSIRCFKYISENGNIAFVKNGLIRNIIFSLLKNVKCCSNKASESYIR